MYRGTMHDDASASAAFSVPLSYRMIKRRQFRWLTAGSLLAACAPPRPQIELPPPFDRNGVHVAVEGFFQAGTTIVGLQGTAENTTSKDLSSCFLYFDVVDGQGTKVADALASTLSLAAGQKWRFQATFTAPFRTTFQAIRPGRVQCLPTR